MGDLDIHLIKEFARRPGFYDRSDLHFKDKVYIQQAWKEISHNLGYDVHLLKDRMLQLRNRYNLEKRRLENLRLENPHKPVRSPWPLFNHLKFLDGHIRPRRSYKSLMSRRVLDPDSINDNPSSTVMGNTTIDHEQFQMDEKHVEIKCEETEAESEEDHQNLNNEGQLSESTNFVVEDSQEIGEVVHNNYSSTILPSPNPPLTSSSYGGISVRNLQTLKRDFPSDDHQPPAKRVVTRRSTRSMKYEAFAKFLELSLCDLPEEKAMTLVEKFTIELVKTVLGNSKKEETNNSNNATEKEKDK